MLSEIFEKVLSKASPIQLSETIDARPAELVRVAKELGFEGILAKRRDSNYECGKRSGAWLNYRINRGQELVIGGYVSGNPIDSIIVGYYQDGTLLFAGKVLNGFVPHTRRAVAAKLKGLENCHLSICESARAQAHTVGLDEGRDEKLHMGAARGGRADRVYRVDAGCASPTIRFRWSARRQRRA